jgi:regulator of sigma E protease
MEVIIMAAQLLLGLSILVGVHEAGHMLAAKYFGMRVEKFSIGFPPKVFGFTKGETEYSIGAIPLGGFVKISGMIDESLDTKTLSKDPEPWEFRAKPAWQRLIVMMGGIVVNIITGILILVFVIFIYGEKYFSTAEVNKRGIVAYNLAKEIGLQTGDKIIKVNGKTFDKFLEGVMSADVLLSDNSYYTVQRGEQVFNVKIPNDFIGKLSKNKEEFLFPIFPFKVGKVESGMGAGRAGIMKDDKIVAINNIPINYFHELQETLQKFKSKQVTVKVMRGEKTLDLKVNVDGKGHIGIRPVNLLQPSIEHYNFLQSIPKGTEQAFSVITNTIKGFGKIFKGDVSAQDSISGPIGIAQEFGGNWDWQRFWSLVGFLSMVLAFMNFLPIPALDGGHVMFLGYEMIARRKPSDKFMEVAQKIGMVILLALMVFAFGNDIFKIISGYFK